MASFVAVPAETIERFLQEKGFTRTIQRAEVVYERCHNEDPCVKVKVYTSIRIGRDGQTTDQTRECGKDSIKVCTVVEWYRKSFGIGKFPHVFRVGSTEQVLERMYQRMRAAYQRGTTWLHEQKIREVMAS